MLAKGKEGRTSHVSLPKKKAAPCKSYLHPQMMFVPSMEPVAFLGYLRCPIFLNELPLPGQVWWLRGQGSGNDIISNKGSTISCLDT